MLEGNSFDIRVVLHIKHIWDVTGYHNYSDVVWKIFRVPNNRGSNLEDISVRNVQNLTGYIDLGIIKNFKDYEED